MTGERLTYRFGPLERRGLLGQLRGGQAARSRRERRRRSLCSTARRRRAARSSGRCCWGPVLIAFAPLGRQPLRNGRRSCSRSPLRLLRGRLRFRSRAPAGGMLATERPGRCGGCSAIRHQMFRPRSEASGSSTRAYRDQPVGVLSELRGRRLTAVLACRVLAFSLLDADAQERRLARWGLILGRRRRRPIQRIQWIERTAPAQGDELARWLHDERDPAVPLRGTPMIESYLELIGSSGPGHAGTRVLIAVQVDARRVARRDGDGPERPTW